MHRYEIQVLKVLKCASGGLDLKELMVKSGLGKDEVRWALQNLQATGMVSVRKEQMWDVALSEEGEEYANNGLPERRLMEKLEKAQVEVSRLEKEDSIGFMWAKKRGLVAIEGGKLKLTEKGREAAKKGETEEEKILIELRDKKAEALEKYQATDAVAELRKRGLIEVKAREEIASVRLTEKGMHTQISEAAEAGLIENLDAESIRSRAWEKKRFRPYNVEVPVEAQDAALRHPLRRLISEIREAYTSMGFREVSGPIIDSSFWVYDYLFMPQHHPARNMQDTFFLSRPSTMPVQDRKLIQRMKKEHEKAWREEWSEDIALQAVPRSHLTSVTGRHMNDIINRVISNPESYELPIKIFSIGRVFRNENADFKHLAEFYQMDGMVIGKNLTLANLFDVLLKLYGKFGIKLKFKPSFFPFVEPGVEAFTELPNGEPIELFGAGVMRREITGIKRKSLTVLAWGPGVERIMLFKNLNIDSIASMYNTSAGWLRDTVVR